MTALSWVMLTMLCVTVGCRYAPDVPNDQASRQALSLLMPRRIEIVEAFTAWASFDGKPGIDGIVVNVQPINTMNDPIQASGRMAVELYAFRPASGDAKGNRLERWELLLGTSEDQLRWWNRATQMYEFALEISPQAEKASPGQKFVLLVTHESPLGEHQSAELVLDVPLAQHVLTQSD